MLAFSQEMEERWPSGYRPGLGLSRLVDISLEPADVASRIYLHPLSIFSYSSIYHTSSTMLKVRELDYCVGLREAH